LAGSVAADGRRLGRVAALATGRRRFAPRSPIDMIIAATGAANRCTVVTINERHFRDVVAVFNPLRIDG
jgi:predicted nucleic acid-binding protein